MKKLVNKNTSMKCYKCEADLKNLSEDDIFCSFCGYALINECTNSAAFNSNPENEGFHEERFELQPDALHCSKCGANSLFKSEGILKESTQEIPF